MNVVRNHFPHILAFVIVVIWGTTFVSTKMLITAGLKPGDIFFVRFFLAYLCILPFSYKHLFAANLKDEVLLMLAGITGGSLYFLTENIALEYSYCSNVSLIVCSTPLITTFLLGIFYRDERIRLPQLLCSFVALAGMALVVLNGHFVLQLSPVGDMLALVAAVTWAFYSLLMRTFSGRYSMLFVTRKVFFYGLLTILPVFCFWPLHTDVALYASPLVWGNLLFLGVVASFLCYFGWNYVMSRLGVVRSTNYIYLNPVVTLIASHWLLDERVTPLAVVGMALILGGIYFEEYFRKKRMK